ncbi:hypothetical protein LCGC14_0460880 [marine sediment metagenome]|uniref:DUF7417 domain-containing protein n=1 Tax=marine sediment metagenome TaxID=412755 RepID=A0A0F9V1W4_9ZZZZ|nr:hypothetical protein [bacterium]
MNQKEIGDLIDSVIDYEMGEMPADKVTPFFQQLIDSGLAWSLQGFYGRHARSLIDSGLCHMDQGRRPNLSGS